MPPTMERTLKPLKDGAGPDAYRYSSIKSGANEIRVAKIKPAENRGDAIRCELINFCLDDKPTYRALSYTWGDDERSRQIDVDGKSLWISRNLDAALKRLRLLDSALYIWVDRICIDQDDDAERSAQTARMRNIYKQAENVCVWLGETDANSELAWGLIENLVDGTETAILTIVNDKARKDKFEALKALFRRAYWWRVWVIQEVNCGRENGREVQVFCGDKQITWTELLKMSENMKKKEIRDLLVTEYPNDPTSIYSLTGGGPLKLGLSNYSDGPEPPLMALLYTHMSKLSSDPKDKVYALVGISSSKEIETDYTWSVYDAYVNTAWRLINATKSLDLICVSQNDNNKYNLPSWVPDWERRSVHPNHRVMGLHIRRMFKAAGDSVAICSFSDDKKILTARGFIVDSIGEITYPFYMEGNNKEEKMVHTLKAFIEWWRLFSFTKGDSHSAQEEFRRTLCGGDWNADYDKHHRKRLPIFCSLIKDLCKDYRLLGFTPPEFESNLLNEVPKGKEDKYAAVSAASLRMHSKCFALSKGARSCLTPRATKSGDLVCVLLGCKYPVILRHVKKHFVLIGEVYVDGIMEGELMDAFEKDPSKEPFKAMDFNIH